MKITELVTKETVLLSIKGNGKIDAINELVNVLNQARKLFDHEQYKEAIVKREKQSTTGIGNGIAIPHARDSSVKETAIAFGKSTEGVDFEALDGQPSHLFFMIATPAGANQIHLEVISRLAKTLVKEEVRKRLIAATTVDEVLTTLDFFDEEGEENEIPIEDKKNFIVAVTACPTGIAHTYMAAESLKAKAAELGVDIRVETNGLSGAKNSLTIEEIKDAVAVIVAADTKVEMERFKGKVVLEKAVADGIRKPEDLIKRALKQDAPIFKGTEESESSFFSQKDHGRGIGARIYKHIMNGVSNILPFAVGGGILISLALLFGDSSLNPNDPTYNDFAATLYEIGGGNVFALIVPVLAGFIARSIADRPGFAPGMVAGMLAARGGAGILGGIAGGFLAGYVVIGLKKIFIRLPASLEGIKSILIYPLLGISITAFFMKYLINEPATVINMVITEWFRIPGVVHAGFIGMVLGLMMAFDMGGPVNKLAYLFGIGLIVGGVYEPMAAIMAAGMVPPLAIALATTFFKNRFTKQDQVAGKANYIKGLSFISEGAIPFAARDPLRVIPSVMVGSAITGAISMVAGIGIRIPHGGILVFPLLEGSWMIYLSGIIVGSIVSALILGFLKKPILK
jgi:fructose PTS system EIIBC or EIIC component